MTWIGLPIRITKSWEESKSIWYEDDARRYNEVHADNLLETLEIPTKLALFFLWQ